MKDYILINPLLIKEQDDPFGGTVPDKEGNAQSSAGEEGATGGEGDAPDDPTATVPINPLDDPFIQKLFEDLSKYVQDNWDKAQSLDLDLLFPWKHLEELQTISNKYINQWFREKEEEGEVPSGLLDNFRDEEWVASIVNALSALLLTFYITKQTYSGRALGKKLVKQLTKAGRNELKAAEVTEDAIGAIKKSIKGEIKKGFLNQNVDNVIEKVKSQGKLLKTFNFIGGLTKALLFGKSYAVGLMVGVVEEAVMRSLSKIPGDIGNWVRRLKDSRTEAQEAVKLARLEEEKAWKSLTEAQKVGKRIELALRLGDNAKAADLAESALKRGVVPQGLAFMPGKKEIVDLVTGEKSFEHLANFRIQFLDAAKDLDKDFTFKVTQQFSDHFDELKKLAINSFGKKLDEQVVADISELDKYFDKYKNAAIQALKDAPVSYSQTEKLEKFLNSDDAKYVSDFFAELAILEASYEMMDTHISNLENLEKALDVVIKKLEKEIGGKEDEQAQMSKEIEPQTQTPAPPEDLKEYKIKISKSKLIDLISQQVKEQTQTIEVDKDQLVALVAEEAKKQISRKK